MAKDICFVNATATAKSSSTSIGVVAGQSAGTIENCSVQDSTVTAGAKTGGVAGYNSGSVTGCTFSGTIEGNINSQYVGGIVGENGSTTKGFEQATIKDCVNKGAVQGGIYVGGIVGSNGQAGGRVVHCTNEGDVSAKVQVGGIAGLSGKSFNEYDNQITGCTNSGKVTATSNRAGGIVGQANAGNKIEACGNTGIVTSQGENAQEVRAGGIVGLAEGGNVTVENCWNQGDVSGAKNSFVGGLVGQSTGTTTVTTSYTVGEVTGNGENIGAVVGSVKDNGDAFFDEVYYLKNGELPAVGGNPESQPETITGATAAEFASGEVAWNLQEAQEPGTEVIWGQYLEKGGTDPENLYPSLIPASETEFYVYNVSDGKTFFFTNNEDLTPEKLAEEFQFENKEGYTVQLFVQGAGGTLTPWDEVYQPNLILIPGYQPVEYKINYELDGAAAPENPATYTVETEDFTLKNPEKEGFTFTGWSGTGLTGEENLEVTVKKGTTGDLTFTAHFTENDTSSSEDPSSSEAPSSSENPTAPGGPQDTGTGDGGLQHEETGTPATGDTRNPTLWIVLGCAGGAVAIAAIVFLIVWKRKS